MSELEVDVPLVRSYVAKFAARSVIDDIISLVDMCEPMENGIYYPLFMLCMQQMYKMNGKDWLYKQYTESKINLQNMLPGKRFSVRYRYFSSSDVYFPPNFPQRWQNCVQ
jgi:translation initiation factor 4G